MLEPYWCCIPNEVTLSRSDLGVLTVDFTNLLEQNFHLEVASQNIPRHFRATVSTFGQGSGRQKCFSFSSVPAAMGRATFIRSARWSGMSLVRIRSLLCQRYKNVRLRHSYHVGLYKFSMPQLINFSIWFSSLAHFLTPCGTSSVTDKQDGDLSKC